VSQPLPTGDFRWVDPDEVELFNYTENSEKRSDFRCRFRVP